MGNKLESLINLLQCLWNSISISHQSFDPTKVRLPLIWPILCILACFHQKQTRPILSAGHWWNTATAPCSHNTWTPHCSPLILYPFTFKKKKTSVRRKSWFLCWLKKFDLFVRTTPVTHISHHDAWSSFLTGCWGTLTLSSVSAVQNVEVNLQVSHLNILLQVCQKTRRTTNQQVLCCRKWS